MIERITSQPWADCADKIMSDGEWHDGRTLMRMAEKLVTPGVANRHWAKINRHQRVTAPPSPEEQRLDDEIDYFVIPPDPPETEDEPPLERRIALGKHDLLRRVVMTRISTGRWEVDVPKITRHMWRTGGWSVRDVRVGWHSLKEVSYRYPVSSRTVRELVQTEPELQHELFGARKHLMRIHESALPELDRRVDERMQQIGDQRTEAARNMGLLRPPVDEQWITMTQLAQRSRLATKTARVLMEANPTLGWEQRHGAWRMPTKNLPAWEKVLDIYYRSSADRRSDAARKGAVTRRQAKRD